MNASVVETYIPLWLYVRSEVYDFYAASDRTLSRLLSELGYIHFVNHASEDIACTTDQFSQVAGRIKTMLKRLYTCSHENMVHQKCKRNLLSSIG